MTIPEYIKTKSIRKSSWVTCYDYPSAQIIQSSPIDGVLVGDSLAMTIFGDPNTLKATTELIASHTQAVAKGLNEKKILIADLPFLSYRGSLDKLIDHVLLLMQSGAHGIKLEGAKGNIKVIEHLVESGIPVMGHLGLTPQSIHQLGGFKVQGKTPEQWNTLIHEAQLLEKAGCFSLVLECVPFELAKEITQTLKIPVIGIGAGHETDGQILVWHDMMGYPSVYTPKFVRCFGNVQTLMSEALASYHDNVINKAFPSPEESYR